ncbi:MAG: tRNA pseudouridine(38-40) synthase TruA [Bacteroidota bacterium]
MRFFLEIAYRGTNYHGWQSQPNAITIQEEIEKALALILKQKTSLTGSGRTDTGVHANQQIAHFDSEEIDEIDERNLIFQLNSYLSRDIAVRSIKSVHPDANARFSAISRTYHYHLHQEKDPFKQDLSYFFPTVLEVEKIKDACELIRSWQNFECFSKVHTDVNHFDCDILSIEWTRKHHRHLFSIKANRFLRGMVRAIVGTLLDVGLGRNSLQDLQLILESRDRSRAGRSVPAHGLYLEEVTYPNETFLVQ